MQDINYWRYGCMETTVEVSCCKYPNASSSELEEFWLLNKKSLIEYLKLANTGVRGFVSFKSGIKIKNATIRIDQREPFFKTNNNGEYYRILLPGRYNLTVAFNCDDVLKTTFEIDKNKRLLELNITLDDSLLIRYKSANLSRYAVFCGKSNGSCSSERPSKIEIITNFFKSIFSYLLGLLPKF
jgi:hypothetical protein